MSIVKTRNPRASKAGTCSAHIPESAASACAKQIVRRPVPKRSKRSRRSFTRNSMVHLHVFAPCDRKVARTRQLLTENSRKRRCLSQSFEKTKTYAGTGKPLPSLWSSDLGRGVPVRHGAFLAYERNTSSCEVTARNPTAALPLWTRRSSAKSPVRAAKAYHPRSAASHKIHSSPRAPA